MEPINKQLPELELWLQDAQAYVFKMTGGSMKKAGFHFDRNHFTFTRKNKKSLDQLAIIFVSHFPVNFRISFQLDIWHPQIKQIKESFLGDILNKDSNLASIILQMKDFTSQDSEQQPVKDYSICDHRDLFMACDWLAHTLQYELIPICDQMSSIAHLDDFFESKPDWTLNSHSGGNICTDLIVARLNGKRDVHQRYRQLFEGLQQKIGEQLMTPESRHLLTLCYERIK